MSKALALDYDGLIADTNRLKSEWIATELGREVPPWRCDRTQCVPLIGLEDYERMSGFVYGPKAWPVVEPTAGALAGLTELARTYRLFIVTARTPEQIRWTKEWLARRGIEGLFEGIHSSVGRTKAQIARQLSALALVDDDARHLRSTEETPYGRLLYAPDAHEAENEPGIIRVRDWLAIVATVCRLDEP